MGIYRSAYVRKTAGIKESGQSVLDFLKRVTGDFVDTVKQNPQGAIVGGLSAIPGYLSARALGAGKGLSLVTGGLAGLGGAYGGGKLQGYMRSTGTEIARLQATKHNLQTEAKELQRRVQRGEISYQQAQQERGRLEQQYNKNLQQLDLVASQNAQLKASKDELTNTNTKLRQSLAEQQASLQAAKGQANKYKSTYDKVYNEAIRQAPVELAKRKNKATQAVTNANKAFQERQKARAEAARAQIEKREQQLKQLKLKAAQAVKSITR